MIPKITLRDTLEDSCSCSYFCGAISRSDPIFVEPAYSTIAYEHDAIAKGFGASHNIDTRAAITGIISRRKSRG